LFLDFFFVPFAHHVITLFCHVKRHVITIPDYTCLQKKQLTPDISRGDLVAEVRLITYERLPDGIPGTIRTLAAMAAAVRGDVGPDYCGYRAEVVRRAAIRICMGIWGHDSQGELGALFEFVRDQVRYRADPWDTERVQDPCQTLLLASGDCDDKCVLLAALVASLGYLPRFVVQSQDRQFFDHVYLEVERSGQWVALDPTADGQSGLELASVGWRNPTGCEWIHQIFEVR
jgi:hypothetical protein